MSADMEYPNATIFEIIKKNAEMFPARLALEFMDKTMTYKDFLIKIESIAASLYKIGIRKGDRVALCLPNCPQAALSIYALNRIGAVAVVINPLSPALDIFQRLNEAVCMGIVVLNLILPKLNAAYSTCPTLKFIVSANIFREMPLKHSIGMRLLALSRSIKAVFSNNKLRPVKWEKLYKNVESIPPSSLTTPDDAAVIIFSGGTSGKPKGAVYSSFSMNAAILQALATEPPIEDDMSMLAILPFFHIFGLTVSIHMAFAAAGKCILVPRFNPDNIARLMIKKKPTYMAGVPTIFEGILKSRLLEKALKKQKLDMSGFRLAFCGGDKLSEKTYRQFNDIIKNSRGSGLIVEGYGLTESCPVTVMPRSECRKGSLGKPFPGVTICVVNPGTTREVPPETEGEICVSTPAMMTEYLNSPEETANVLKIHHDGKTWLHTGDIGVVDKDGFLFYHDRLRRLIKVSGYSVFANHVEEVLQSHPAVYKACVIGILDEYTVRKIKAYIVLRHKVNQSKIRQDLIAYCRSRLTPWSVPSIVEFRGKIPMNLIGKVSWGFLEEESIYNAKKI